MRIINQEPEMDPDAHDGSYELMRNIVSSYSKIVDYSVIDYKDLNAVYAMAIGTFKLNVEKKKDYVNEGHLPDSEKARMETVIDKVWDNACRSLYENREANKPTIGMFGTGFYSFERSADQESCQRFIKMMVDISNLSEDGQIFDRVEEVFDERFKGMQAAAASVMLHCLKPFTFPILNANFGDGLVYGPLGIKLDNPGKLTTYIGNCRMIKEYRDKNMTIKNYRILDRLPRKYPEMNKTNKKDDSSIDDKTNNVRITTNNISKNTILYGPPGTGKTYNTVVYAVAIIENKAIEDVQDEAASDYKAVKERYEEYKTLGRIEFTTFHQSYGYEEFIEGIKPVMGDSDVSYSIEDGVFKKFCLKALDSNESNERHNNNYVFIIDEINRGNISKIFGELITLVEETKRIGTEEGLQVSLPYSKQSFGVPNNVYILGTMNTADRSIAIMDTALRRRFAFKEMLPDSDVLRSDGGVIISENGNLLNVADMLDIINNRIMFLFDREHTIGHAFFMPLKNNPSVKMLASIFERSIIPLLQEYFYEDYEKIQFVLGDDGKTNDKKQYQFISDEEMVAYNLFETAPDFEPAKKYSINYEAFYKIESYKLISKKL